MQNKNRWKYIYIYIYWVLFTLQLLCGEFKKKRKKKVFSNSQISLTKSMITKLSSLLIIITINYKDFLLFFGEDANV